MVLKLIQISQLILILQLLLLNSALGLVPSCEVNAKLLIMQMKLLRGKLL